MYALDEKRTVRFLAHPVYKISYAICQFLRVYGLVDVTT
jgi:hypothetical protein